jgi:hypothetical protein
MTPALQSLLLKTAENNKDELCGPFGGLNENKVKELIYTHASALDELDKIGSGSAGAVFIGATRHLVTIEVCGLSTALFSNLSDKHFFATTKKRAEELLERSRNALTGEIIEEIGDALEIEKALRFASVARTTLSKLKDTDVGRKASATLLGSLDSAESRGSILIGGMGCAFLLVGGGIGFAILGLLGLFLAGFLAFAVAAILAIPFSNQNRAAIVKLHNEFRASTELLTALGLMPEDVLRNPQLGLDKIEEFELYAGEVIAKHTTV